MPKFEKGQSGNPGGRPKGVEAIRKLAQQNSRKAILRLVELMDHENGKVSVAACQEILNRAWGKPAQPVTGEGGEGAVVVQVVRFARPADGDRPA